MGKYKIIFCLLFVIVFLVGCSKVNISQSTERNKDALYDIYFNASGNVGYIQIDSIQEGKIHVSNLHMFPLKKDKKTISYLSNTLTGEVYATVNSVLDGTYSDRVIVFKEGKIKEEIVFSNVNGPVDIISDKEKNKSYIISSPSSSHIYPNGTPVGILNNIDSKQIDHPLYIKGTTDGWAIDGNYIYVNVGFAQTLSTYNDVPDNYIMRINRDDFTQTILTKSGFKMNGVDLVIPPNKKIYLLSNGYETYGMSQKDYKITIFNLNGEQLKEIKFPKRIDKMVVDQNGIAYISHKDKQELNDRLGETITIFDTNTDETIGEITGFKGPEDMKLIDTYLFVTNQGGRTISVIDTNTRKTIGDISLGEMKPYALTVIKNK